MFAFAAIGVFLTLQVVTDVSGRATEAPYDTKMPALFNPAVKSEVSHIERSTREGQQNFYFYGNHQTLYFNPSNEARDRSPTEVKDNVTNEVRGYAVNSGVLPWNAARKNCAKRGGLLLIIRSDAEHKHVDKLLRDHGLTNSWLGLHDQFEEGDWVSILGEEIAQLGWAKWSPFIKKNPDNYNGRQNCAHLMRDKDGMDDLDCIAPLPFVCTMPSP